MRFNKGGGGRGERGRGENRGETGVGREWERGREDTNPNIQMLNKAMRLYTITCTICSKVNCLSYMMNIWVLW